MQPWIKGKREVWIFTAIVTALAVIVPLAIVGLTLGMFPDAFGVNYVLPWMVIAGLIPLFITPPIAFVVLNLLRVQGEMIGRVHARIMFDMMTGLHNRNHFLDSMRASHASGPIMIVDADHFKAINDNHGHAVGDEALRILANAIRQTVGHHGIVGRLGGEEFGIFMPAKDRQDGHAMADAVCAAVRSLTPLIAGHPVRLTVSIGCSYHRSTNVIGHSLKKADDLLYRAKAEGRDRAVYLPDRDPRRISA
jgi:diguanylate cyclase (GGDEF)-like protein